MYSIFVQINGCVQLKKTEPEIMANLENDLMEIIKGYGLSCVQAPNNMYAYLLPSDHVESVNVCLETLKNIQSHMANANDNLYGYSIFVSVVNDLENVETGPWIYEVDKDNATWTTPAIKKIFGNRIETVEKGSIYEIKQIILQKVFSPTIRDTIYQNESNVELIQALIKRGIGQVLHLVSPVGYGGYEMVYKVWQVAQTRAIVPLPMIYLCPQGSYIDEYLPFRRVLNPRVFEIFEETYSQSQDFITLCLLNWLASYSDGVSQMKSETERDDLLAFFRLYLPLYRRIMATCFPVMVVEDFSKFSSEGMGLLREIVEIAIEENVVVINLCERYEQPLCQTGEPSVSMDNMAATQLLRRDQELAIAPNRLNNVNPMAVLLFYWNFTVNEQNYFGEFSLTPLLYWLIKGFDNLSCSVVYLISLSDGMVPYDWILDAVVEEKYWRALTVQRCKIFADLGLVRNLESAPWLTMKALGDMLLSKLGDSKAQVEENFIKSLLAKPQCTKRINLVYLFKMLESRGMMQVAYNVLEELIQERLSWQAKDLQTWLNYEPSIIVTSNGNFDPQELRLKRILETYNFIYTLRNAGFNTAEALAKHIGQLVNFHPETADATTIRLLLAAQIYYDGIGKPKEAPVDIKEIVSLFQKREDQSGEARAILEMSYIEFLNKRFRTAFDYCALAEQFSVDLANKDVEILSIKLAAVQAFLQGSMATASEVVARGIRRTMIAGYRRKEVFFRFLDMRISFEYGDYQEALSQIKKIQRITYAYDYTWVEEILLAWKGRCLGHINQFEEALSILKNLSGPEALYYAAEIHLLSGYSKDALASIRRGMQAFPLSCQNIPQIEIEHWTNGYNVVEGYIERSYLGFNVLERLTQGFFYYLMGINGEQESAVELLEDLCPLDETNSDDPYSHIYFYYYGEIHKDANLKKMAQSRAVRLLNTRINREQNIQARKMLENGYYAKKILNNRAGSRIL